MSVDWSKAGSKAHTEAMRHEDAKTTLIVRFGNAIDREFDRDPNSPLIHAMMAMFGLVRDTDVTEALTKAGFPVAKADDAGPKALNAAPRPKIYPLFNEDGTPQGTGLPEDEAVRQGYHAKLDIATNEVTGYIKPRTTPLTPPPPPPTATLAPANDPMVDVKDARGRIVDRINVSKGRILDDLEVVLKPDHTVDYFKKKPRIVSRATRRK